MIKVNISQSNRSVNDYVRQWMYLNFNMHNQGYLYILEEVALLQEIQVNKETYFQHFIQPLNECNSTPVKTHSLN